MNKMLENASDLHPIMASQLMQILVCLKLEAPELHARLASSMVFLAKPITRDYSNREIFDDSYEN